MRTANDLPVKQFVRVGVGSAGLSPISDSLSFSLCLSPRFFLCLPFFSLSHWSLRGPCSQGRLLRSSSLASRLLFTFSSSSPRPPHLQLSASSSTALPSLPSSLPSHLNLPLSFDVTVFLSLSLFCLSLSLFSSQASSLSASVRQLSYARYTAHRSFKRTQSQS